MIANPGKKRELPKLPICPRVRAGRGPCRFHQLRVAMPLCHPAHLDGFVIDAAERFSERSTQYVQYCQLVCICGGKLFQLYVSDKASLRAECATCATEVTVYDRSHYPSSNKQQGVDNYRLLSAPGRVPHEVFLRIEYGEFDADEVFDRNDVTWFTAFVVLEDGSWGSVFDDETA